MVAALNDLFSRQEKRQADPYLETREKEDRFLRQVLDTISEGIQQGISQNQSAVLYQPVQSAAEKTGKEKTSGADSENYEIAEAFMKEMGL